MGFQVISLTPAAIERVRYIVAADGANGDKTEAIGIKVGIKKGGCAGMEYTVDKAYTPESDCDLVEYDGFSVFIDRSAVLFLLGSEMDYQEDKLRAGFVFNNPNQLSACGCGESVELRPAELKQRLQSDQQNDNQHQ